MNNHQQTIKYPVSIQGISLHSGKISNIKISPAFPNTGIKFFLSSSKEKKILNLDASSVIDTTLSTNIGKDSCSTQTIEHLMSALHALQIDNVQITVQGDSIPILDGSSIQYYHLLKSADIERQDQYRSFTTISKDIEIKNKNSFISMMPYDGLIIDMTIKFNNSYIGKQSYTFDLFDKNKYETDIAPARTFGVWDDIQIAIKAGLIKGGSLDNAIVINDDGIMNDNGLRFETEFVRHKILDFIGDIYINGPIKGYFEICCTGHGLTNQFMKKLNINGQKTKSNKQI
jgi:UDP-3-O-[3-hydroxymyristoyl] N-acetylglucosamine deacetylase